MALTSRSSLKASTAFGRRVAVAAAPVRRAACVRRAAAAPRAELDTEQQQVMIPAWPDKQFVALVTEAFPEKGIASVEEARVLYETGYTYLDVRPTLEIEETGKVKNSVNVPLYNAKWQYNAEERKKEVKKSENPEFVAMVEKRFPNKEAKLMIACSNGQAYTLEALQALDEAGYVNLTGLRGGYYAWFRIFDNKLNRRRGDGYTETYTHDGDSCGIHSTGAGFAKSDQADAWVPPAF